MSSNDGNQDFNEDDREQAERQYRRRHVIVINGSPLFLNLVREFLQEARYNVTTTNYVPRVFDQIRVLEPDLVILDFATQHEHGQELLASMRGDRFLHDLPVIVTSTDQEVLDQAAEVLRLGPSDHRLVIKPLDIDDLMRAVSAMLAADDMAARGAVDAPGHVAPDARSMVARRDYTRQSTDEARRQLGRKRVFVVNGSPEFLNVIRELLQEERYNVTTSNYLDDVMAMIEVSRPDVVIVDLVAHQPGGWDLLRQMAEAGFPQRVPVIISSVDPHVLQRAQAGEGVFAHRFMVKPTDVDEIVRTIAEAVGPA